MPCEGCGVNYGISPTIATDDLTVTLTGRDGNDLSGGNAASFAVGGAVLGVVSPLAVTVTDAMGDIFAWDAGKIQANDADLFVYLINNNGAAQIGVSPCPTLTTVATNYYDDVGQTGSAGHTNIVMSGTRHATNACIVIGRIRVNQEDDDDWVAPGTAKVIEYPIWETDWLTWTPTYTGFSANPTNIKARYKVIRDTCFVEYMEGTAGTSDAAGYTVTAPILAKTLGYMQWTSAARVKDAGSYQAAGGCVNLINAQQVFTVQKTYASATAFTDSGNKSSDWITQYMVS